MMSITSVCITLCFALTIAQSGIVTEGPQVSREGSDVALQDNGTKSDREILSFARATVDTLNIAGKGKQYFRNVILAYPPGSQRIRVKRIIMDAKVFANILTGLYKGPNGGEENLIPSSDYGPITKSKIIPGLVNGVIERLEPKPCLREFMKNFFKDGGLNETKIRDTKCDAGAIYSSQWYQSACREKMEESSEEEDDVFWSCGAPNGDDGVN